MIAARAGEKIERIARQRAGNAEHQLQAVWLFLQADLDQHDRQRENETNGQDRRNENRRLRFSAESGQGEWKAHIARVGISAVEAIDGSIGERTSLAKPDEDRQREAEQSRRPEGGNESRLPDLAAARMCDDVEEQRGERKIDDITVEFARGRRPEKFKASCQPTGEDHRENRQDDRKGREHVGAASNIANGASAFLAAA